MFNFSTTHEKTLVFCIKVLHKAKDTTQVIDFKDFFKVRVIFAEAERIKASIMRYDYYDIKSCSSPSKSNN